ncbi:MAG: isoaspartyl peptidase/L-asparaginase [Gammaproteobacteria bacterium]|nr:isoaspartyl peptidase/L-asparaginase [Gammaproteobacteria bacterium]
MTEIPDVGRSPDWVIAIHGGAGSATRESLSAEAEAMARADLTAALEAGGRVLAAGATGPEAIVAALTILEDSPRFNAGRGAALDEHGQARHDASIMRGEDLGAGAIAGSSRIKNPIAAARAVMERTGNVMLHGEGADWFAANSGLETASPLYFITDRRREILLKERAKNPGQIAHNATGDALFGTVGAVVLDRHGNIAAGTTTGGRTNKRFGRIGDTPVIGAGNYASNTSCAVSATGHGEYFMRWTVARDICARVEFAGETLEKAAETLLVDTLLPEGGTGGVVTMQPSGKTVFVATTANLKRGVMSSGKPARVAVYSDEEVR